MNSMSKSTRRSAGISKVLLVIIIVIATPLVAIGLSVGLFSLGCNAKANKLASQADSLEKSISEIAGTQDTYKTSVNRDCFTGSGSHFSFSTSKHYETPMAAIADITSRFNAKGIPALSTEDTPEYIFAEDGNSGGGDTPIGQIRVTYDLGGNSYEFVFQLPQKIPCAIDDSGKPVKVLCNGIEKDTLVNQLLASQPIDSTSYSGTIH